MGFLVFWIILRIILIIAAVAGVYALLRTLDIPCKKAFLRSGAGTIVAAIATYALLAGYNHAALGWSAILLGPLVNGFLFVMLYAYFYFKESGPNATLPRFFMLALLLPCLLAALQFVLLFALLLEGIICLLMAAPFYLVFTLMGAMAAYAVMAVWRIRPGRHLLLCLALAGALPILGQPLENQELVSEEATHVATSLDINAPPEKVFFYVAAFPAIPAERPPRHPGELMFLMGLPAPQRSTLDCEGPGCMRHCIFNQNVRFDEKMQVYHPGRELTFSVVSIVGPQSRVTGVDPHVMPGGIYFDNQQGQFLLDRLPGNRTRIRGTTWYTLHSSLNWYAEPWARFFLHTIHRRVLEHIKTLAETDS